MATSPDFDRMNIDVATGLYRAWMSQEVEGEKMALDRLPAEERKAMDEVVKFYLDHQKGKANSSSLPITDSQRALIKRLGVVNPFPIQRIKDQFLLLTEEANVRTKGLSSNNQKAFFDEVLNLLNTPKYRALNHPGVVAEVKKIILSSPSNVQELNKRFCDAIDPKNLPKRVVKTAAILSPMVKRDEKIQTAVASANPIGEWVSEEGKALKGAYHQLILMASKDFVLPPGGTKNIGVVILDEALNLLDHLDGVKGFNQQEKAILQHPVVRKELKSLLNRAKNQGLNPTQAIEAFNPADRLLSRLEFWADQGDEKLSFDVLFALAQKYQSQFEGTDPRRIDAHYEKAVRQVDRAIKTAEKSLSRSPLIRAILQVFGYENVELKDLEKAKRLKSDIALSAYLVTKSDPYFNATVSSYDEKGMLYLFKKGIETGDDRLALAATSSLANFFQKKLENDQPFSEAEKNLVKAFTQLQPFYFSQESQKLFKTDQKAFQTILEQSTPTWKMAREREGYIHKIYADLFKANLLDEGNWDSFKSKLQSAISGLSVFKEPFRPLSENPATIWLKLYNGNEKQVVKALLDYFPEGEKREQFVKILTTFDSLIESYKKAGAKEGDMIPYLASAFGTSLIQPNEAVRQSIPQERSAAKKKIVEIVSGLLQNREAIFEAFNGRTTPL